jgi:2-keto-3-deoxy-L-rhamnonate aldolase RhmA
VAESLADALAGRAPLIGTVLTLPGATAAELLAEPFDLVWVDLEHGALGPLEAQEMILGAQAANAYALVRVPAESHSLIAVMLDAGADGVVLANVGKPAQATAALNRVALPPAGSRGWGPRRLAQRRRGSKHEPGPPSVWVQIESTAAVERVEAIAAVPGIGAVVVGTADLSFSLGVPLDGSAPALVDAVATVREACGQAKVAFGVAGALDRADPALLEGAAALMHSTDASICARAVDQAADWLRGSS